MQASAVEFYVAELHGFLNAARCVMSCPRRIFSSSLVPLSEGIDEVVERFVSRKDESIEVIDRARLSYRQVRRLFIRLIYRRLAGKSREELENFDWVLIEYFGLISTADLENGPWNRLVSQVHNCIFYAHQDGYEAVVFFVEYSDFAVAVQLGLSWPGQSSDHGKSLASLAGTG